MRKLLFFLLLCFFIASCAKTPPRQHYPLSPNLISIGLESPTKIHGVVKNPYGFEIEATIIVKAYDEDDKLILVEDITGIVLEPHAHVIFDEIISSDVGSRIERLEVVGKAKKRIPELLDSDE